MKLQNSQQYILKSHKYFIPLQHKFQQSASKITLTRHDFYEKTYILHRPTLLGICIRNQHSHNAANWLK